LEFFEFKKSILSNAYIIVFEVKQRQKNSLVSVELLLFTRAYSSCPKISPIFTKKDEENEEEEDVDEGIIRLEERESI